MKISSSLTVSGYFEATLSDPITGKSKKPIRSPNLVTRQGKVLIARLALGQSILALTYQALGTGTTQVRSNDTGLATETVRRIISLRGDTTSNTAALLTFFPASLVPSVIDEVGVFGGDMASSTANSGILFARALLHIDTSANEDLTISYVLTIN